MNRWQAIDSNYQLDGDYRRCHLCAMTGRTIPVIILDRCDPTRNMARYYVLSIEPSLFGDTALVRQWGRQGRAGRQRIELYREKARAIETLEAWIARKTRRGYVPRNNSFATPGPADEDAKFDPVASPAG
jgi:predicted DNA-binding WGR domain protein